MSVLDIPFVFLPKNKKEKKKKERKKKVEMSTFEALVAVESILVASLQAKTEKAHLRVSASLRNVDRSLEFEADPPYCSNNILPGATFVYYYVEKRTKD